MKVGERVGPFDIEKRLGSGAMGSVYRARYRKTGQRVAIKVMAAGLHEDATSMARFEREAEVLKQLNHPNIVRFYVASHFQEAPYYAMEYVEGEPLDQVLQRRSRLTWEEVVELGKQVCAALQHAHGQGIVHRDLKPSNLMITADGTCKLTDFGIAKDLDVTQLTAAHCTVGTAAYMSPEQCRGERNLTHKSDLYSLGVVFYELLTGSKPFLAETTMDMFLQHVQGTFERPSRVVLDIPVWLDTLVCQLLEKKPEHRPYDAAVVAEALNQVAEKVAAQQSAGVDAARARAGDRTTKTFKADNTDRAAARTLLTGLGRRRRKRRGKPFYEKAWVQAIGILVLLLAMAGIFYQVFFRRPDADKLFQEAEKRMLTKNFEDWVDARGPNGPIGKYLRYYGSRNDEQTGQVHQWADQIDVMSKERGLLKKRKVLVPEEGGETIAYRALEYEDDADLARAHEQWQALLKYRQSEDHNDRILGLLAEKRVRDLQDAEFREQELPRRIVEARKIGEVFKPSLPAERLAADALRYEEFKDFANARAHWLQLKQNFERDLDRHFWFLLAAKKAKELKAKKPSDEDEVAARVTAIANALADTEEIGHKSILVAKARYREIVNLYEKDEEPRVKEMVAEAKGRLEKLTKPDK